MKKLAVLSNINIDPLKNFLNGNELELYFAGYNQWQSELTNSASNLYKFNPEFIFLHLDAEELRHQTNDFFYAIECFIVLFPKTQFIISNFFYPPYSVESYINTNTIKTIGLNNELLTFRNKYPGIFIFDFNRLVALHGYRQFFSHKFWYLGRIKYTNAGFRCISQELKNVLNCLQGRTKKVLALDLDNTLWGGILGEEVWNNIQLSEEGVGKIYTDFQRNIKKLSETGILLAIVSKNNEADVKEAFEQNENMLLSWDSFVSRKINWNNKTDNLREIAIELNIGIDSIVFIDDNVFERDLVKKMLPEVTVPDFPEDITELNYWFINDVVYPHFSKNKITSEDLDKTEQYKRNSERANVSKLYSYDEFLQQLDIKLDIKNVDNKAISRISHLTQKTNQFNLNAKKYTESELNEMINSKEFNLFSLSYSDKFGNEGITGAAIIKITDNIAELDIFLLSCRILGRNVEFKFLDFIINSLTENYIKKLKTYYFDNGKNNQVKEFLLKYGFYTTDNIEFKLNIG